MKKNKAALLFGVVFLSFVVLGFLKTASSNPPQNGGLGPKIVLKPKVHDFGEVEFGQLAEHEFSLKNEGDQPLEINRVSTSCGCTKASVAQESLAPGEATKLMVSFDPEAMGKTIIGKSVERFVYIRSNDLLNPQAEVTIHARVK